MHVFFQFGSIKYVFKGFKHKYYILFNHAQWLNVYSKFLIFTALVEAFSLYITMHIVWTTNEEF
jgi:hypothetical protein